MVTSRYPALSERRLIHETVRHMINELITDLIEQSRANILAVAPDSIEAVRALKQPLISFSETIGARNQALAKFLRAEFYFHPQVRRAAEKAGHIVRELFAAYCNDPAQLPDNFAALPASTGNHGPRVQRARLAADYVAGMTDRFALKEYRRVANRQETPAGPPGMP
jgi:dGTPase